MSIGKRLFDLARSELNSLLDRAADAERFTGQDPDEDLYHRFSLDEISDTELEAELERRQQARKAKAEAARQGASQRAEAKAAADKTSGGARGSANSRPPASRPAASGPEAELRRAYAALEVPWGSDFATVRTSYRALMRKYHPDRHAGSAEKQKAATELAQKLTAAYELIEKQQRQRRG